MTTETTNRPNCPECGTLMGKREKRWSGRHRKQLWLCSNCGRTKLLPIEGDGSKPPTSQTSKKEVKPTVKPPEDNHHRLCPHKCAYNQDGICIRKSYTFTCPLTEPEWNELITEQKG